MHRGILLGNFRCLARCRISTGQLALLIWAFFHGSWMLRCIFQKQCGSDRLTKHRCGPTQLAAIELYTKRTDLAAEPSACNTLQINVLPTLSAGIFEEEDQL